MPTVLLIFGIRFYFYSREHEPMHVHIENADGKAKFVIEPQIRLAENKGMKNKDIRLAESIIEENRDFIVEEWRNRLGD